jgi:hypothetical protein
MDKIRCSNCRGAKKVAKLGGMLGDCNLCLGTGLMNGDERSKAVAVEPVMPANEVIKQVASIAAVKIVKSSEPEVAKVLPEEPAIKVDPKKAIYKRKKA